MFGFLKDKLKNWLGKTKEKVEEKAKVAEPKKQTAIEKKQEKIKEEPKKQKLKRTKEQIKQERDLTEKVVQDIKAEGLEIKSPEEKTEDLQKQLQQQEPSKKLGFFAKLKQAFTYKINEEDFENIFEELELSLLENNVAIEVVDKLKSSLKEKLINKEIKKDNLESEITQSLKSSIEELLLEPEDLISEIKKSNKPYKILFFGINGAGKTTSIAKLAYLLKSNNISCVLAAADTFRAAFIEQLEIHANKLDIKIIKHDYGSDPSAVAFDAIKYAEKNRIDVVLIDTAGRMHTKENLLKEMEKICKVSQPNLKVFVAEAVSGNDATQQAKVFNEMIGIDGSILSKTDVDEKGGTILSIGYITKKPIIYLGIGQNYKDLELFKKSKFIERLGFK